jgi:hypothetical protein
MKKAVLVLNLVLAALLGSHSAHAAPTLQDVTTWATARMASWQPAGKSQYPGAKETESEGLARYGLIAQDAFAVAYDPAEAPLFSGPNGRAKTMATLLAIASWESGFRKDVDTGSGPAAQGDGGRSWCLVQIQLSKASPSTKKTSMRVVMDGDGWKYAYDGSTGWGGEDLVQDRQKCFRAGLHMARVSFKACSYLPVAERLSVYASGNCQGGRQASALRMNRAISWLSQAPAPADDATLAALLAPVQSPVVAAPGTPLVTAFAKD